VLVDRMTANGFSQQRLADAAQATLAVGAADEVPPSLTALTFAAAVARAAGDAQRARGLLDQALAAAEDSDTRVVLAQHLSAGGRLADAIELLETRLWIHRMTITRPNGTAL
jgi:thioredoxin-like negative regulator of GroEL